MFGRRNRSNGSKDLNQSYTRWNRKQLNDCHRRLRDLEYGHRNALNSDPQAYRFIKRQIKQDISVWEANLRDSRNSGR